MPTHATLNGTNVVPPAQLGTGTPDGTKFLRDDNTWAVPSGGGGATGNIDGGVADSTYLAVTPIDAGGA